MKSQIDAVRSTLAASRVETSKLRDTFGYYDRKGLGQGKYSDEDVLIKMFYALFVTYLLLND